MYPTEHASLNGTAGQTAGYQAAGATENGGAIGTIVCLQFQHMMTLISSKDTYIDYSDEVFYFL
jgi:hypothetical protein